MTTIQDVYAFPINAVVPVSVGANAAGSMSVALPEAAPAPVARPQPVKASTALRGWYAVLGAVLALLAVIGLACVSSGGGGKSKGFPESPPPRKATPAAVDLDKHIGTVSTDTNDVQTKASDETRENFERTHPATMAAIQRLATDVFELVTRSARNKVDAAAADSDGERLRGEVRVAQARAIGAENLTGQLQKRLDDVEASETRKFKGLLFVFGIGGILGGAYLFATLPTSKRMGVLMIAGGGICIGLAVTLDMFGREIGMIGLAGFSALMVIILLYVYRSLNLDAKSIAKGVENVKISEAPLNTNKARKLMANATTKGAKAIVKAATKEVDQLRAATALSAT